MLSLFNRIKTWWIGADRSQRTVTVGGVGALLLLLAGTVFFATRPHFEPAFQNLTEMDQGKVIQDLNDLGIPAQAGKTGVVEVPAEKVREARGKLAAVGKLPNGPNHLGFSDLDKINPMTPPEVMEQTIRAIFQDELASILETFDGVAAAKVIITKPRETVFQSEKEAPTASVTLTEKFPGTLGPASGKMIANLVCSSVTGMRPKDVYVGTSSLTVLWDGHNGEAASTKGELDAKAAGAWEKKIQGAIDGMYGENSARVLCRADVDTSIKTIKTHEDRPTETPMAILKTSEDAERLRRNAGGIVGADANTPGAAAPATPPADGREPEKYKKKGVQEEYGNSTSDTTEEGGSGGLKALAITIGVNQEKIPDVAVVEDFVRGLMASDIETDAAGLVKPNQKFNIKVRGVKFDNSAALLAKEMEDKRASAARTQQILSLLPIGAILVVALLVAKQVGKISRAILPAPASADATLAEGPEALPGPEFAPPALPAGAPLSEETLLALEPFKTRIDIQLESVKQMAVDQPEMVATLIKSMMLGDKP